MEGYTILCICDYAANYTGSFVPALLALKDYAGEKNEVRYLFPEAAQGKPWIALLSENPEMFSYCAFSPKELHHACKELAGKLQGRKLIVHTHFVGDFNLLAVKSCFGKVFCHYHMMVPGDASLVKKCKRAVRRFIYRGMVIIGVSEAVCQDAMRYFPGAKAECVPNAVDFDRLEHCTAEPVRLPEQPMPGQVSLLVHASDFVCKGIDLALYALEELNREHHGKFRLYLTSNHVDQTEQLVKCFLPTMDNAVIVPSVENIRSLYDSVDIYLSPSREEAFGYAVVEAAYCGCQVVASDIPGQNTMKQVPGILWMEKENICSLKAAILEAVERKEKGITDQIKAQQRSFVREHFAMKLWAEKVFALYEKHGK